MPVTVTVAAVMSAVVVGWTRMYLSGVGAGQGQAGDRHRLARADVLGVEAARDGTVVERHVVARNHTGQRDTTGIEGRVGGAVVHLVARR